MRDRDGLEITMHRTTHSERGSVMIETAVIVPILLLLMVGIFEVGRLYQTWQVVTNAAREGARMSVTPFADDDTTEALVRQYMQDGALNNYASAAVNVDSDTTITVNGITYGASQITIDYPFDFIVLNPVAKLVASGSKAGKDFTMRATALMRNEAAP
jgi:Flp pilus assembly protein TadG